VGTEDDEGKDNEGEDSGRVYISRARNDDTATCGVPTVTDVPAVPAVTDVPAVPACCTCRDRPACRAYLNRCACLSTTAARTMFLDGQRER
jgi:hypothetical protein